MTVDIIMLVYNTLQSQVAWTEETIKNLKKTEHPFRFLIVNNGSTMIFDASILREGDLDKWNPENIGYARGNNQGFEKSSADIVGFFNNDMLLEEGWLEKMLKPFEEDIADIVFPTDKWGGFTGFCWLIRRKFREQVGEFSLDFGLGSFEDTDYWMRCHDNGCRFVKVPVHIFHEGGATFKKLPRHEDLFNRNKKTYESKWGINYPREQWITKLCRPC